MNNYTDQQKNRLKTLMTHACPPLWKNKVSYIVFQQETGRNGTHHLQGYIEFKLRLKGNNIKALLGSNEVHIERRRGTPRQASDYCKKNDTRDPNTNFFEEGTISNPTAKDQLNSFVENLQDKSIRLQDVIKETPLSFLKSGARARELREMQYSDRKELPQIMILTGPSGCGKSTLAKNCYPDAYHVPKPTGGRWWWPNYEHEECIIIDEFREDVPYSTMLRLLDSGPFLVEYKGGNQKMTSNIIIITSNLPVIKWYSGVKNRSELFRRIMQFATVWEFTWLDDRSHFDGLMPKSTFQEFKFTETLIEQIGNPDLEVHIDTRPRRQERNVDQRTNFTFDVAPLPDDL